MLSSGCGVALMSCVSGSKPWSAHFGLMSIAWMSLTSFCVYRSVFLLRSLSMYFQSNSSTQPDFTTFDSRASSSSSLTASSCCFVLDSSTFGLGALGRCFEK